MVQHWRQTISIRRASFSSSRLVFSGQALGKNVKGPPRSIDVMYLGRRRDGVKTRICCVCEPCINGWMNETTQEDEQKRMQASVYPHALTFTASKCGSQAVGTCMITVMDNATTIQIIDTSGPLDRNPGSHRASSIMQPSVAFHVLRQSLSIHRANCTAGSPAAPGTWLS